MKAICLQEPRHFEIIDVEEPGSPGPGEALVAVHRVGICGTDLSGYLGKFPFYSYPRIPGHELGVEVLEVGEGVSNIAPGDRCSVEPYINNPDSYASRNGLPNCCEDLEVLGVHRDGGLRPRFILPARKLHKSTSLSYEQLALVETLAIGCHCVDRAAPAEGDDVLIIGAGPIGLSVIEFARLTGARLIVMDMNPQRLEFCRETMGVDDTLVPGDDVVGDLRNLTDGNRPGIVIDATGHFGSMSDSFGYVAPGGKLVYVGLTTTDISLSQPVFHRVEGTLLCSRNALPDDFSRIIGLIETGVIDTGPWITHRLPFDDVPGEFEKFTRPETGAIKAIIEVQ